MTLVTCAMCADAGKPTWYNPVLHGSCPNCGSRVIVEDRAVKIEEVDH